MVFKAPCLVIKAWCLRLLVLVSKAPCLAVSKAPCSGV